MLKLYYHPRSTFSRRIVIALAEKDISYEAIVLDMGTRAHRAADYLAFNPYGRVPTIDDDGFVLYESAAILRYLEETRLEPPLLPADPKQRALADMYIRLCDIQMARHAGIVIFPKRFLPKERWNPEAMAAASTEIQSHLDILDRQLAAKEYLVAGRFTMADLAYIPFLHFLPLMDVTAPPAVAAWAERLLARPSAVNSTPDI
jgi:glutathione S-transferase